MPSAAEAAAPKEAIALAASSAFFALFAARFRPSLSDSKIEGRTGAGGGVGGSLF